MTTATAPKRVTKLPASDAEIQRLKSDLDTTRKQLAVVTRFLDRLQTFSDVVCQAKQELRRLESQKSELENELRDVKESIRSVRELISSSNDSVLAVIEPGPAEFMPLFDRMEKAQPEKHGANASKWREKPIALLRLSPTASACLIEAEILFIGQLQDRILDAPTDWWEHIPGLTAPIAAAIADKLTDFAGKGGEA